MRTKTKETLKHESNDYMLNLLVHIMSSICWSIFYITNDDEIVNYGEKEIPLKIMRTTYNPYV